MENSLVLKNDDPFPGFHLQNENGSIKSKPESIFIILRYRYPPEKVNRIIHELVKNNVIDYYPSFGEIITPKTLLPCIRLKNIEDYSTISLIQESIKNLDLLLMPFQKVGCCARIKIFKTFKIIEINDGIYRDLNDGEKAYIKITK